MIQSKIMVGKDVISKLSFEHYYNNCKSVLVIFDLQGDICGAKSKIKKILPKGINVRFVKVKDCNYAETGGINKCLLVAKEINADMVVCTGSEVALNVGKAVRFLLQEGTNSFEDFCGRQNNIDNINKSVAKESNKDDEPASCQNVKLAYVAVASGNHQQALTGYSEVYDKTNNTFFRLNKKGLAPDIAIVDSNVMDKKSEIAMLGEAIGVVLLGLIAIGSLEEEEQKLCAISAIDMVTNGDKLTMENLVAAKMLAGYSFLSLKNNLLDEFVFGVQRFANSLYSSILLLTLQKNVEQIVDKLRIEDIKLLGKPYGISSDEETAWKEELCSVISSKIDIYFEDKDIDKNLSAIGLSSRHIEEIFEELDQSFGDSDILRRLKDIVYNNY